MFVTWSLCLMETLSQILDPAEKVEQNEQKWLSKTQNEQRWLFCSGLGALSYIEKLRSNRSKLELS